MEVQSSAHSVENYRCFQRDIRRLRTADVKFMSHTTGYSLVDNRRN